MDINKFVKERNEALLSLDKEKLVAYAKKYWVSMPKDELIFWAGIHKARLGIRDFPDEEKEKSRVWLKENGFKENLC